MTGPGSSRTISSATLAALALSVAAGVVVLRTWVDPSTELRVALDVPVPSDGEPGRPQIRIVLQPADCPSAEEVLSTWRRAADSTGVLDGAMGAILLGGTPAEVEEAVERLGGRFPVRAADGGLAPALRALGFRKTPILLAFDGVGRLRVAAPLHESPGPLELLALLRVPPLLHGDDR